MRKHDGPRYERYRKVKMKITNNPSNEEFWQFEGRIAVRANIGISMSPSPGLQRDWQSGEHGHAAKLAHTLLCVGASFSSLQHFLRSLLT